MRVGEEIDALVVMGIDPVSFLVVPRLAGLLIALPCLTIFSDLLGILGGFLVGVFGLGLAPLAYLRDSMEALVLEDIWGGLLKAACFAVVIGLVGCQRGLSVRGGPEQVGDLVGRNGCWRLAVFPLCPHSCRRVFCNDALGD